MHDGSSKNPGRVSIAHHGETAPKEDVHKALKELPWQHERKPEPKPKKKRDLSEGWDDLD